MSGFYCQKVVGDDEFSIDEWNKQFKICNDLEIKMPDEEQEECPEQCFNCIAIVGERRKHTQELMNKNKTKNAGS